jgi:glycosyltransferase involved in cell wall biosynthesis
MMLTELGSALDRSRVHFTGHISHEQFVRLLQVSTAHTYLTYPYTLSWSFAEAMSAGCLVIGSRTGPVEEVISDRKNGLLVDFFSPEALADRIVAALRNRDEMRPLRDAARRTALERYDFKRVCLPQHLRLIDDLVARRTP